MTQEYCIITEKWKEPIIYRVTITANGSQISDQRFEAEDALSEHPLRESSSDIQESEVARIVKYMRQTNGALPIEDSHILSNWNASILLRISKLEKQSRVLEDSISKLCHRVAEIRSSIAEKEAQSRLCKQILASIRRLPLEILQQVLLFSTRSTPAQRYAGGSHIPTPVVIGQVCRLWRQISLNLPQLWDAIEIVHVPHPSSFYSILPESSEAPMIPTGRILDLCFQRSLHLPLTLSLRSKYLISGSSPISMHISLVNAVTSVASRIESLTIQAESKSVLSPLFSDPRISFTYLKSLTLEIADFEDGESPISIFETCPKLHRVVLDLKPTHDPFSVRIPWGQITHLDMLHGSLPIADATWRMFIRHMNNLEDGRFCLAGRVSTQGFDVPFLNNNNNSTIGTTTSTLINLSQKHTLSNLHTLTIRFVGQELPQNRNIWLLRNLNLPNIQNFHFSFVRASTLPSFFFWRTENLQGPLLPYLQNLKSFTLWAISISIPELIDVLKMTVSLERFRMKAAAKWTLSETRKLVNALMLKNSDGETFSVAPSLKNLVIWADNLSKEQAQSYLSMIMTRRLGEGGRKAFKMTLFCRQRLVNVPEGIMVCVEERNEEG